MYTFTKEKQQALTPVAALQLLVDGNARFASKQLLNRDLLQQVSETATGQYPFATIVSCMDSRTSAELIFDKGIGDIFSIRVAGNVINTDILGSIEYATKVVGTKIVVVLGHTKCGAIAGACNHEELGNLTSLLHKIQPAIDAETTEAEQRNGNNPAFVHKVTRLHVHNMLEAIRKDSAVVAELEAQGAIDLIGGLYDIETGLVSFFE